MTPARPTWLVIDDLDPGRPVDARPVVIPSVAAFDALYWTIGCPLPNGATLFRFYDRKTGLPVGGGASLPYGVSLSGLGARAGIYYRA